MTIRTGVRAAEQATRHACNFTMASDKANVGGPSLQNSLLVLADGTAMIMPPQVGRRASARVLAPGAERSAPGTDDFAVHAFSRGFCGVHFAFFHCACHFLAKRRAQRNPRIDPRFCSRALRIGVRAAAPARRRQVCSPFAAPRPSSTAESTQLQESTNKRHAAWLQRLAPGGGAQRKGIWRPRKRHRTSVLTSLKNLDRQLKVSSSFGGLRFVMPAPNEERWLFENWLRWPGMLLTADQGGDMFSGGHCLQHHLKANVLCVWDWSHGAQRDLVLSYEACDLFRYALIFLVCMNLYSGPDKDEGMRFEQLTDAMRFLFQQFDATSVLFQARADAMLAELGDTVQRRDDDASLHAALWRHLEGGLENQRKMDKVKMAQFMGWISRARWFLLNWEQERFKREFVALECNCLDEKAAAVIERLPRGVLAHAAKVTGTSASATQVDTKLLRSSTVNNLAMSVCFMDSTRNKRIIALMTLIPEPLARWQQRSASACRYVAGNLEWLLGEWRRASLGTSAASLRSWRTPWFWSAAASSRNSSLPWRTTSSTV